MDDKLKKCVVCGNNFYWIGLSPNGRLWNVKKRPKGSFTCSHTCSMKFINIRRKEYRKSNKYKEDNNARQKAYKKRKKREKLNNIAERRDPSNIAS